MPFDQRRDNDAPGIAGTNISCCVVPPTGSVTAISRASSAMKTRVNRQTVDLSQYPDLVVVYLGMRANALAGMKTLLRLGPQIQAAGDALPEGLLHCEQNIIYGFFPFHVGMRWYWKDFASLEAWTRSPPHREWWTNFLRGSGGTGFWHETYFRRGGIEAVYLDAPENIGLMAFAPVVPARGPMFGAASNRLALRDSPFPPGRNRWGKASPRLRP